MLQPSVRRAGRIEWSADVFDLQGSHQWLPATLCEVEEHRKHVNLHFGEVLNRRVIRITHRLFHSLFAIRQVVFVSW